MVKYKIIGNMTGNSMDAIDLVLTEFDGDKMHDLCSYTKAYDKDMQNKIEYLRQHVCAKSKEEILNIPEFYSIHDEYIKQIAKCIDEMCKQNNIDKSSIDAIGFHGKTLDHNPPAKARREKSLPYTLQMGSGQMLADLTQIPVIYDFRSDFIMNGFDGAPLVPPHNAHIAKTIGDGCYYNGGNTSNFAIIENGKPIFGSDAGPFNEYIDGYIRKYTSYLFDKDGMLGLKGILDKELLQKLFDIGRNFYETPIPKSGDPAYYHQKEIFDWINALHIKLENAIYTLEYFAAYIAFYTLGLAADKIKIPDNMLLFGGGWKNPVVLKSFDALCAGKAFVLPEHKDLFVNLQKSTAKSLKIEYSNFGEYMEARLFADLAYYKLENRPWKLPDVTKNGKEIVCGIIAYPHNPQNKYNDCINRAAKGWQNEMKKTI